MNIDGLSHLGRKRRTPNESINVGMPVRIDGGCVTREYFVQMITV